MLNLATLLENSAHKYAGKTAFTFMDTSLSFAQINSTANQVANALMDLGIKPGDKVAMSCFNLPYFPIIYNGILKAGAIVVPLSILLKSDEIQYHLDNSDAKAYFCFAGTEELPTGKMGHEGFQKTTNCEHFFMIMPKDDMPSPIPTTNTFGSFVDGKSPNFDTIETKASDTAVIIYTSGTTGRPKGAELTHSNLFTNAVLSADLFDGTTEDIHLIVLPLFHIFAMTVMMNAGLYRGATSILLPRFDAEAVLNTMHKHKVTVFAGVPTMYWGLNNYLDTHEFDISSIQSNLKSCLSGGASLPIPVLEKFEERFKITILEGYGMSEGSPIVTFNHMGEERVPGSIGRPVWGVEVKLVDDEGNEVPEGYPGELTITTLGIEAMPLLRFRTGDVVVAHRLPCKCGRNTLRLGPVLGRKKQMIKYKGTTLYPPAMDNLLNDFSEVTNHVIEIYHNEIGTDEIKIKITTSSTSEKLLRNIKDHFRSRLRVSPKIEITDLKEIQKLQASKLGRKPITVIDTRTT